MSETENTAQTLLLQHHDLLDLVDQIESELSPDELTREKQEKLSALLRNLLLELEVHFAAEAAAYPSDLGDKPELEAELRELDQEHPVLLKEFGDALAELELSSPPTAAVAPLQRAVTRFRDHEAREDALFAAD